MIWALKKVSQVTSEGETLILRKNAPRIHFDKKIANTGSKIFLLTTKLYKNPNNPQSFGTQEVKATSEVKPGSVRYGHHETRTSNK